MKSHRLVMPRRPRAGAILAGLTLVLLGGFGVAAEAADAPVNDAYLNSLQLNAPGKPLNHKDTLRDVQDTTAATVQTDLFDPPSNGGPAEVTTCHGTSYGQTVWYDFHPDANGTMSIRTSGYDNVITLYTFDRDTLEPHKRRCMHRGDFPSEQLVAPVKEGRAYTVQIGGVGTNSGSLETLFDFAVTVLKRLRAEATLTAAAEPGGIELRGLTVSTVKKARVAVSCSSRCRRKVKQGSRKYEFRNLKGVHMPAGSRLRIRVTAPKSIGVYIAYNIRSGSFTKVTRCLRPGSRKPRRKCR
jgi:hypothetical protein